jgi:hypothetical protein
LADRAVTPVRAGSRNVVGRVGPASRFQERPFQCSSNGRALSPSADATSWSPTAQMSRSVGAETSTNSELPSGVAAATWTAKCQPPVAASAAGPEPPTTMSRPAIRATGRAVHRDMAGS